MKLNLNQQHANKALGVAYASNPSGVAHSLKEWLDEAINLNPEIADMPIVKLATSALGSILLKSMDISVSNAHHISVLFNIAEYAKAPLAFYPPFVLGAQALANSFYYRCFNTDDENLIGSCAHFNYGVMDPSIYGAAHDFCEAADPDGGPVEIEVQEWLMK